MTGPFTDVKDVVVEVVAKALYDAWAEEAGLHETWEDCARRGHSIVASCRKGARAAISAYLETVGA